MTVYLEHGAEPTEVAVPTTSRPIIVGVGAYGSAAVCPTARATHAVIAQYRPAALEGAVRNIACVP
jgi:hypothetical protein